MSRAERRRQQKIAEKEKIKAGPAQGIDQALSLAVQHHTAGNLQQAEGLYQQVLKAAPKHPVALHLLGVIAHQAGQNEKAVELISSALAVEPNYTEAHYNLGGALKGLGRLEEAAACYGRAIATNQNYAEAHSNLGGVFHELGRLEEAAASYSQAIALKPDHALTHANLGVVLLELGQIDGAFTSYRRAVSLAPQNNLFWAGLAASLNSLSFETADEDLYRDLLALLDRPTVLPNHLAQPIVRALEHHPAFHGEAKAEALSGIPLFLHLLSLCPINDLKIERMLTGLRRDLLTAAPNEKALPFDAALALNCFTNEYVFPETEEEKAAIEALADQISGLMGGDKGVPPSLIAALGSYRPLYEFPWAETLANRDWTGDIKSVIVRQILEPFEERSLRQGMTKLTPIEGAISQSVRQQYEENPYPRWVNTGREEQGRDIGSVLQGAPLRFDLGNYVSPEHPNILVAGCGTGQHPLITAAKFANAKVLAVDLSLSSLSYAQRKTTELGVSNIEFAQADIMELGSIDRRFDLIESAGVLHHLGDPVAGWQVLTGLLRPGGLMKIALYSETARQDVVEGRALIAEAGYTASPEDIRRCRQDIIARAEAGDEKMADICGGGDFYSASECRDLLFHVQEHRFTIPQIEAAMASLGLRFLGFELANQAALKAFKDQNPEPSDLTDLSKWHAFELAHPSTFEAMYQFWCQKA